MNNTLYQISENYLNALESIEIDEETGEILNAEKLEQLQDELEVKLDRVACYVKTQTAFAEAMKTEEAALYARRKRIEKKVEYLRGLLGDTMGKLGADKFETERVKLSFRRSTSVEIEDMEALPDGFLKRREVVDVDKAAIKAELQGGGAVPGAILQEKKNLQIK